MFGEAEAEAEAEAEEVAPEAGGEAVVPAPAPAPTVLETDATHRVVYRTMVPSDVAAALPVFAEAFYAGEPVTGCCGCTLRDHLAFTSLFLPRMADEGNTVVAVDAETGAILGGFLCEDYAAADPPGVEAFLAQADGDWAPVLAMIDELEARLGERYAIPAAAAERRAGEHFHLWMLGVAPAGRGRGIAKKLTAHAIEWARAKGYATAFAECTGSASAHILQAHAARVAHVDYGAQPWEGVRALPAKGHAGMALMVADFFAEAEEAGVPGFDILEPDWR